MIKLYHCIGTLTGEPHDNDLFVRAATPEDAARYWRAYYEAESSDGPDEIDEIPEGPADGAIPWDRIIRHSR